MFRPTDVPRGRRHWTWGVITLLGVAVLAAGCSRNTNDLQRYIAQVKARRSSHIAPIPQMKPFETFTYPSNEPRDPFAELSFAKPKHLRKGNAQGPRPDLNRPKEELENFPLDALRMVGTIVQKGDTWALIKDPSGTIHRVQVGNYMGQNQGKIVAITGQSVKLRELIPDGQGGWMERNASLALKE